MAGIIGFNNHASNYFTKGTKFTLVPFTKFQWTIAFDFTQSQIGTEPASAFADITYIAQSVDLPNWDIETQTINQYNKRRTIATHVVFKPVTVTFFDTVDNKFKKLLLAYMNYTSRSFGLANDSSFPGADAILTKDLLAVDEGFNGEFGQKVADDVMDNFISTLQINQEQGGWITPVQLLNPKIVSVTRDNLDFTNGNGVIKWSVTFQPEGIRHLPDVRHPDYTGEVAGAIDIPSTGNPNRMGQGNVMAAVTSADSIVSSAQNTIQTTNAISSSMNNVIRATSSPTAALNGILSNPGGSIPIGTAINGSSIGSSIGKIASGVAGVIGPVTKIAGIAGAITQLPGMSKYMKGPLGQIASTGLKLRAAGSILNALPGAQTGLQKYIKGFDPRSLGGGWL